MGQSGHYVLVFKVFISDDIPQQAVRCCAVIAARGLHDIVVRRPVYHALLRE